MASLLTWNAIVAFSEQCVAKLVHGVLLFYLVASSRVRKQLQSCTWLFHAAINLNFWYPF